MRKKKNLVDGESMTAEDKDNQRLEGLFKTGKSLLVLSMIEIDVFNVPFPSIE